MRTGIINRALQSIGIGPINFFGEVNLFPSLYVWSGIWQGAGYSSIIYIAALAGVSPELQEAAIVDGAWDADAAKAVFGDNYACSKLPSFTVDGQSYQMSGFGGFKLLGVKPQTEPGKQLVCLALAEYLSNEETQLERFNAVAWGPSNLVAQQSDAVKSDAALSALAEQLAYTIPQGQYPTDYWNDAISLGDDVIADKYDNMSDDELMKVLEDFQARQQSYAQ